MNSLNNLVHQLFKRAMIGTALCVFAFCAPIFAQSSSSPQPNPPPIIQDNSFLIEEAYNQERGIVQHISSFARQRDGSWVFTFTDEWPVFSQKHQFSVTLLAGHLVAPQVKNGIGDVLLNYRYQLVGNGDTRVAIAPRISMLLPTGFEEIGLRSGGAGLQFNFPVSIVLHDKLVTHVNAGLTYLPSAHNEKGETAALHGYNIGDSLIWQVNHRFNLMLEAVYLKSDFIAAVSKSGHEYSFILNPGFRWAYNFSNGLQIVPGVAFPTGLGPSHGQHGILLYLSFEHPFTKR